MILPVNQIRKSEKFTIEHEPISSIDLMERAATSFVEYLLKHHDLPPLAEIAIFCGPGNNGGDGLVIARLLAQNGFQIHALICTAEASPSDEFAINLKKLKALKISNLTIIQIDAIEILSSANLSPTLVIDALFGIGLSKPLTGYFAEIVHFINTLKSVTIAVDVPSGLYPDKHTPKNSICIHADLTFTFQYQKLAYLLPENESRVGQVSVIDIGLSLPPEIDIQKLLIDSEVISKLLMKSSHFAHKGSNGHGLLIAGSAEMPGAALLAAKSALRGGIGKVTVHTPTSVAQILAGFVPEAVISHDDDSRCFSKLDIEQFPTVNAIAIGPGLGQNKKSAGALSTLIDEIGSPMIFDADALNILAENKTWLSYLPEYSILTPHFKEFERLTGKAENDFDRLEKLTHFAKRYSVIVVLKGAHSAIAMPDGKLYFNTTGNPGMATAGSGDVLTGLLLAQLAKGYPPEIAAMISVFIHGLAGDIAVHEKESYESLMATDIIEYFGEAFHLVKDNLSII
ncbi:NAD(P)H-hydrate dehydratase [Bacteroidales bacterium OttesenSCG-928-L19]|nr:NAD(P)H-hydrate dehydratase [Bacteroidales bacterium OttesenSCG-928-L19]